MKKSQKADVLMDEKRFFDGESNKIHASIRIKGNNHHFFGIVGGILISLRDLQKLWRDSFFDLKSFASLLKS